MLGNDLVGKIMADYRTAPIPEKLRVTLAFLEKLTRTPDAVTADDVAPLRAAGVSDQGIADAIHVNFLFSIITRMADALEFAIPTDGFAAGVKSLLSRGYQ